MADIFIHERFVSIAGEDTGQSVPLKSTALKNAVMLRLNKNVSAEIRLKRKATHSLKSIVLSADPSSGRTDRTISAVQMNAGKNEYGIVNAIEGSCCLNDSSFSNEKDCQKTFSSKVKRRKRLPGVAFGPGIKQRKKRKPGNMSRYIIKT